MFIKEQGVFLWIDFLVFSNYLLLLTHHLRLYSLLYTKFYRQIAHLEQKKNKI